MAITNRYAFNDNLNNSIGILNLVYDNGTTPPLSAFEDGLANLGRCFRSHYDTTSLGFYFVPANFNVTSQSIFSMSFWVKFINTGMGDTGTIARMYASNDVAGNDYSLKIVMKPEDFSLEFYVQSYQAVPNGSLWTVTKTETVISSQPNTFYLDNWHLITITQESKTGTGGVTYYETTFYIDNAPAGTFTPSYYSYQQSYFGGTYTVHEYTKIIDNTYFTATDNPSTTVNRFYIGGADDLNTLDLNIDELRFYNSTISFEEIDKSYNSGNGREYSFPTFISIDNVPNTTYIYKDYLQQNFLEPPLEITLYDKEGIQSYDFDLSLFSYNYYYPNFSAEIVDPASTKTLSIFQNGPNTDSYFKNGKAKVDLYFNSNITEGQTLDVRLRYYVYNNIYNGTLNDNTNGNFALRPNYVGSFDINGEYLTNDIVSQEYKTFSFYSFFYGSNGYFFETTNQYIAQARKNVSGKQPTNFTSVVELSGTTVNIANNTIYFGDNRFTNGSGINSYLTSFNSTFVKVEGDDLPTGLINSSEWNSAVTYSKFDIVTREGTYYTSLTDNNLNYDPVTNPTFYFNGNDNACWIEGIYKFIVGSYGGSRWVRFGKYQGTAEDLTTTGSGSATFTFFSLGSSVNDSVNWYQITPSAYSPISSTNYIPTFFTEPITLQIDTRTLKNTTLFIKGYDVYQTPAINTNPNPGLALIAQLPPDIIASTTLFVYGAINKDTYLYIQGHSTQLNPLSSPTRTLFVKGFDYQNNSRFLYINGEPRNLNIPLFIKTVEPTKLNNSTTLFISSAGIGVSQIFAGRNLYINGSIFNSSMNLFINSQQVIKSTSNVNLFLKSLVPSSVSSRPLFIKNEYLIKSNTLILNIKTDESGNGYFPIKNNINLYIEKTPGVDNVMPLSVKGFSVFTTTTAFPLYTANNLQCNNNVFLAIPFTQGVKNGNITMYVRGR